MKKPYDLFTTSLLTKGYSPSEVTKAVVANEQRYDEHEQILKDTFLKGSSFWEALNDAGTGVGYDRSNASDYKLIAAYVNNDIVHTCISLGADAVATSASGVYQEVEDDGYTQKSFRKAQKRHSKYLRKSYEVEEVLGHELTTFLDNPYEDLDFTDLKRLTATYVQLMGKAYWQLIKQTPTAVPSGIRILKPYYVFPQRDLEGEVVGYFYTNVYGGANGANNMPKLYDRIELVKEDVIDFRFPAPSDPFGGGDSPIRAAYEKVAASVKFNLVLSAMLDNRARIDGILSTGTELGSDPRAKLEKDFENKFRTNGNGGVFVPDSPNVKFTPVQYSPTDLAPLAVDEKLKIAICNVLHVPPALLDKDANYANMEASLELWARSGITPLIQMLEAKINKYILPLFDTSGAFFAFDNPVPEDEEFELEQQKVAIEQQKIDTAKAQVGAATGKVTGNEIRTFIGLEPIDGEDELIQAVAVNAKPGTEELPPDASANPTAPVQDESEGTEDKGLDIDAVLKINKAVASGNLSTALAINLIAKAFHLPQDEAKVLVDKPTPKSPTPCGCSAKAAAKAAEAKSADGETSTAAKLQRIVAGWFDDLKADALKNTFKGITPPITKADTGNIPTEFVDLDKWINDLKGNDDDLAHRVKPLIELEAQKTADGKTNVLARAGASPDAFDVVPQQVEAATEKRAYRFAQSTLDTTTKGLQGVLDGVKDLITQGVLEGDPVDKLKSAVGDFFENAADYQAQRIAQTETMWAVNAGQIISARASGIVKTMTPIISGDACDICMSYDGKDISIDDLGDSVDSGAVDNDDFPPFHPNCRCALSTNIDLGDEGEDE